MATAPDSLDILFLDDQHNSSGEWARTLLRSTSSECSSLSAFVAGVSNILREELTGLPLEQQRRLPPFSTMVTFTADYSQQSYRLASVDNLLLCLCQLGHWIRLAMEMPETVAKYRCVLGRGLGLVAASAISSFTTVTSFVPIASAHVRLAFHVGKKVDEVSQNMNLGTHGIWSKRMSTAGKSVVEGVLQAQAEDSPVSRVPYISSTSFSEMTVTGSPPALDALFSTDRLRQYLLGDCEGLGCYAASYAYNTLDIESCIAPVRAVMPELPRTIPMLFPETEASIAQILEHILRRPCDLNTLVAESSYLSNQADLRVLPIGPAAGLQDLATGLSNRWNVSVLCTSHESLLRRDCKDLGPSGKIAIVGMSGRFPGGSNVDEFWDMLLQGLDMHSEVPSDRFDVQAHLDPTGKGRNKSHTPFGCFVQDAGLFDPRFFNMSPREAVQTDPMQRLAIMTAYEALEMSGYVANRTAATNLHRVGTFYGQTSDDWREINEAQDIDTYFITGGVRAFGPGRINYFFKFSGPSYSVDTACSSSMAALQIACTALQARECDTAVTGGLNILTNPDIFAGLSKGQFLSKTGNCQTFDNDADGYCRGDGIGTVVLKRLEDALADNDNVLATILATATNHSADAVSITHPHSESQQRLYKHILDTADVDPLEVSYVEMHGTGTQAGDGVEMTSVLSTFAPRSRQRGPHQPLYLGSVKSNIGHGEAASGVSALIKVLLMMRHNTIPPHCGIKGQINQSFPKDMAARNVNIAMRPTQLGRLDEKRTIYISNFSAAGGNSGLLLQDPDTVAIKAADPRPSHVVSVSARALSSLHANIRNLVRYIDSRPNLSLADLAYTTTARRTQHNYKISFAVPSLQKLKSALVDTCDRTIEPTAQAPQIIFTFTGQGSHYLKLANELFHTSARFRAEIARSDSTAQGYGFPSFLALITGENTNLEALSPTLVQVGLLSVQVALCELWKSWGIQPQLVIGHSLGEYAALYAAGVLSAGEAIYLVGARATLLEKHCISGSHAMLAIQADVESVDSLLRANTLEVACLNGPSEFVLCGSAQDVETARARVRTKGITHKVLPVRYAFHSAQIDAILSEFRIVAERIRFRRPEIPVLSSLLGGVTTEACSASYLCDHARKPVNFAGALKAGKRDDIIKANSVFLEIGPQPVTLGFVKSTLGSTTPGTASLNRTDSNWVTIARAASLLHNAGAKLNWQEYHKQFESHLTLLDLPAYSWALKKYWIDYVGNWCLTKGDASADVTPPEPELSTSTVQRVIEETYTEDHGTLVAESDIHRRDVKAAISGHRVNGVALCPSSLYGDIAITVGSHMYKKLWKDTHENLGRVINIGHMEVPKPLIAKAGTEQVLRIAAAADKEADQIRISFRTGSTEHAHCVVGFEDRAEQESSWARIAYLVEDRIQALQDKAHTGKAHVLLSGLAYKLFASLVDYDAPYRGMKRVVYSCAEFEATAEVSLYEPTADEEYVCAPYWLDSVGHLAGFCVNAAPDQDCVHISHGWESLRLSRGLAPNKTYRTYVRMLQSMDDVMVGDVYLFDGPEVVGLFGGLRFQKIPRRVLDIMLPPSVKKAIAPAPIAVDHAPLVKTVEKTVSLIQAAMSVTAQVLAILAEECGVALAELAESNSFSDLGVDSLMQLAIGGRIREHVGIDIPSTLFVDCSTIAELRGYLARYETDTMTEQDLDLGTSDSEGSRSGDSSSMTSPTATPSSIHNAFTLGKPLVLASDTHEPELPGCGTLRKAQSFVLSGSLRTASRKFFMVPDGGGAAISYMHIPCLAKDTVVFGLNSPFMEHPEEYDCGVAGIATAFVDEIRRRQPNGPYQLGGWSAGGVIAYEIVQQLIRAGELVKSLVLIDSPCPLLIEPLPSTLHAWFNSIGLIGDPNDPNSTTVPPWLLPHFSSTITALSTYNARKLQLHNTGLPLPEVTAIWCADGICHDPDTPRPDPYPFGHAQWLLEDKNDFDDGGWDAFFRPGHVEGRTIPGNHFTMMRGDNVRLLGEEIKRAIGITQ